MIFGEGWYTSGLVVAETPGGIPNRAWFRASEVCEIAGIRPYVLRSWESEFPSLGVSRGQGKTRVYRREDVELVLRIKQLVVGEGLTLAGVRRRMEGELSPDAESVALVEVLGPEVRQRVSAVRQGLRSLLEMLSPQDGPAPAPLPFDTGSDEDFGAAFASGPGNPGTESLAAAESDKAVSAPGEVSAPERADERGRKKVARKSGKPGVGA